MSKWKTKKGETKWHIINSLLAGALVMLGSFTSANRIIDADSIIVALIVSAIVIVTKLREYSDVRLNRYAKSFFSIAGV